MSDPAADTTDMGDPSAGAVVAPRAAASPKSASARAHVAVDTPGTAPHPDPRKLPGYARSLLKISVPVMVTLAEKKQSLGQVVELSPGAIIHFDKSCEQMLDLSVAGCKVAAGEAVKVGDKFGLRITSVVLPEERFETVRPATKP